MKPPAHRVPGRFAPDTCAVSLARLWRVYYTYEISFSKQKLHKTLQTQRERTLRRISHARGSLALSGVAAAVRVPVRRHAVRVAGYTGP